MSAITTIAQDTTHNAGVPPVPPEAHQQAGGVLHSIDARLLRRYGLSGEFKIEPRAASTFGASDLDFLLGWFTAYVGPVVRGQRVEICPGVVGVFQRNREAFADGRTFFVLIELED